MFLLFALPVLAAPVAAPVATPPPVSEVTVEAEAAAGSEPELAPAPAAVPSPTASPVAEPAPVDVEYSLISVEAPRVGTLTIGKPWEGRITTVRRSDPAGKATNWRLPDSSPSSSLGLTFSVTGLPRNASFDPETRVLRFTPRQGNTGKNPVVITVSNGASEVSKPLDLTVSDNSEAWLMPGGGYVFYAPLGSGAPRPATPDEMFQGVSVEYLVYRFVQDKHRGPGHGRFYGRLDLLGPVTGSGAPLLLYSAGVSLSLERNPGRSWLLPNFGLEIGGLTRREVGTALFLAPSAALHLYTSRSVTLGVEGSAVVPLLYDHYDDWLGFRGRGFIDIAFW